MTDNEITREKAFSEELQYFHERIKEVFDNYDNPNGYEDPLYIAILRDSHRIVRKAEEEINRQQAEIDNLRAHLKRVCAERDARICTNNFIKSEAVKEFAEKLKEKVYSVYSIRDLHITIDNLVKEMVGGAE